MLLFTTHHSGWYDVYLRTEVSGKQFINYVNTLLGEGYSKLNLAHITQYSELSSARGVPKDYLYTVTNYVEKSIIDSYLELFPEEKE